MELFKQLKEILNFSSIFTFANLYGYKIGRLYGGSATYSYYFSSSTNSFTGGVGMVSFPEVTYLFFLSFPFSHLSAVISNSLLLLNVTTFIRSFGFGFGCLENIPAGEDVESCSWDT